MCRGTYNCLDEFESVPAESVAVGHNNFLDISIILDSFQESFTVLAFE